MMRISGLLLVVCLAAGCRNESAAPTAPTAPASIGLAPAASVTASATPSSSVAPHSFEADASPEKPSAAEEAPAIACTTADDCWLDDDAKPIARPAKLRGKKITPCKGPNGERTPDCKQGKCVVVAWRC